MHVILIPGFWLDASSWDRVSPILERAGHDPHPLTLPGLESRDTDRSTITLRDHVDAVIDVVDSIAAEGKVVLVGHSGGGAVAHAVVDARPERVARAIYVDSVPLGDGDCINDELPAENGEVPLPDWSVFDAEDLVDLDETLREQFRARAIPTPVHVASDAQRLSDERRHDVPMTVIACEFSAAQLSQWMDGKVPFVAELATMRNVDYVDLPTGHWPQFTRPEQLGQAIVASIARD
ncbi:MAG TPA: alpha/beta hydrolase [Acidimicrobiales bacterium]